MVCTLAQKNVMRSAIRVALAIAGGACIVLAALYFTRPADSLPLPTALGYEAGSQVIHVKHGIVALVAGVVALVLSWDMGPPLQK